MRHLALLLLATASLAACQRSPDASDQASGPGASTPVADAPTPVQPGASTGAGGAVTGTADPNPTGAGATTDAQPGAPSDKMGSTPPGGPPLVAPPQ